MLRFFGGNNCRISCWRPRQHRDKGMDYQQTQIAEIYDLANPSAQDYDFYSASLDCAQVVSSTSVAVRVRSAVPSPNVVTG